MTAEAKTEMVPITREILMKCYGKYPIAPVGPELVSMSEEALQSISQLRAALSPTPDAAADLVRIAKMELARPPHKVDANIYSNRCQLEEIVELMKRSEQLEKPAVDEISRLSALSLGHWEGYHAKSLEKVETLVKTFLPQDFRLSIVNTFRSRSEAAASQEISDYLATPGSTIQGKYDILWRQQMSRRQTLVSLGNATGVFRVLLSYLGGVPTTLLDFIKTVNDDNGPMEQFRITYGPNQYFLTTFINRIRMVVALCHAAARLKVGAIAAEKIATCVRHLTAYEAATKAFTDLLIEVLLHSPFFVSKAAMDSSNAESGQEVDVVVANTHEISVGVREGDTFAWEFRTNKDIKFQATFKPSPAPAAAPPASPKLDVIHPLLLVNSHLAAVTGEFVAQSEGVVVLLFDNTYSWLSNKSLKVKTKLTPNPERLRQELQGLLDSVQQPQAPPASSPIS